MNSPEANTSEDLPGKLTYDALQDGKSQFRLLVIEPGDWSKPLKTTIETFNRDTAPAYDAISYTWGDAKPTTTIEVNGKPMDIRSNCSYALAQARHHGIATPIWIDSICINQDDLEEKSSQVSQMGLIFSEANVVYCSVGAHHGQSFWFCQKLEQLQRHFPDLPPDRARYGAREDLFRAMREKILQLNSDPARFVAAYNEFCGVATSYESSSYATVSQHIRSVDYFTNLENVRGSDAAGGHIDLKAASLFFERLCTKQCDDPRDLLYGSLSISRLPLVPDYKKSSGEVALEAVNALGGQNRQRVTREQLQKGVMAIVRRMRVTIADPIVVEKIRARQVYERRVAYRAENDSHWCNTEHGMRVLETRSMLRIRKNTNDQFLLLHKHITRIPKLEGQLPGLDLGLSASEQENLIKSKRSGLGAQKTLSPDGELLGITNIRTTPGDYLVYATNFNKSKLERFLVLRPCKAPLKWHVVGQAVIFGNTHSHNSVAQSDTPFLTYDFDPEDWVVFYAQSILPPVSDALDHIICCAATRFSKPGSKIYADMHWTNG